MIERLWDFFHSIGFHFYTIPAFVVLLIAVIVGLVHWRRQKKRDGDHEDRLKELYEEKARTGGSI